MRIRNALAALALSGLAVTGLAACGTTHAAPAAPPSQPQDAASGLAAGTPAPSPSDTASTYGLAIGESVTLTDDSTGDSWDVTVSSARAYRQGEYDSPPPAGQHYIAVKVTYAVTAGSADVNELDWEAKDASGQTYQAAIMGGSNAELMATTVHAPNKVSGEVYLPVPDSGTAEIVYSSVLSEQASWQVPG